MKSTAQVQVSVKNQNMFVFFPLEIGMVQDKEMMVFDDKIVFFYNFVVFADTVADFLIIFSMKSTYKYKCL
jgi:hypothetical protein